LEEVIATRNLTKKYKDVCAVEDLNLSVNSGEIFGFLGPNGAGKTTTIRVLTTLTKPTSGSIWISGFDVEKEPAKVKEFIGVVQQHLTFDLDLSLRENMELHARLHHIPSNERKQRICELLEFVGLTNQSEKMVDELSGGMKKAAMIARALIHKPKVLFLDEPTTGLDPITVKEISELIKELQKDMNVTSIIVTHDLLCAQIISDRAIVLRDGKIVYDDGLENLTKSDDKFLKDFFTNENIVLKNGSLNGK